MKSFQFPKKKFVSFFLIIFSLMFKKALQDTVRPYIIYQTNNTYPRPLLLDSQDVIGFSGQPVMLSRYNPNGEVIYKGKTVKYSDSNDLKYEQNACIRQFSYASSDTNKEKPRFVTASGNLKLVLFSEDSITETTFSSNSSFSIDIKSYKIDICELSDYTLLVSYVSEKILREQFM